MDVFDLRDQLISDYASCVRSFINIRDGRIAETVERKLREGVGREADIVFVVDEDSERLGTLEVRKGFLDWLPERKWR